MNLFKAAQIIYATFSRYRWYMVVLVAVGFLSAILEGIGINAVIPLISFFFGGTGTPADFISQGIKVVFEFFSVPFTFRYLLAFIVCLFILRAVAMVVFGYVRGLIMTDFVSSEGRAMFKGTLLTSWPFLLKQKIGYVQNILVRDLERTGNLLQVTSQLIQAFTGFLMYLLVAINISAFMTLLTVFGGGVLLFIVRPLLKRAQRMSTEVALTEKNIAQFLSEHIIGMKSIKAAAAELKAYEHAKSLIVSMRNLHLKMIFIRSLNTSLFQPFGIVFIVILFSIMYQRPDFNIITFGAGLYLIQRIFIYLESLQSALHSISELVPYAIQVNTYKQTLSDKQEEVEKGTNPFIFEDVLRFEQVSFAYESNPKPILLNADFSLKKGEMLGIVGPSGAGKTSIADLLLRLFEPTEGNITIDSVPIRTISLEEWRLNIGYVSQDAFLLNTTIADNIRFYRDNLSEEEIVAASKKANIYDFICSLPEGFQTMVGDRGVLLSGGQRQRIVLARALAHQPTLLVLDEATSALDHESEKLIQEAIYSLHGEVTVVIIAHRPSTVADADRILALDQGRIVEEGAPAVLIKDKTSYFYRMQQSS